LRDGQDSTDVHHVCRCLTSWLQIGYKNPKRCMQ
jgi:hypothetical protein